MTELRLNGNDGEFLLLESLTGDRYRLLVDDNLRSAIRSSSNRPTSNVVMTPREIQAEIRSGVSVEDLIARTGDPRNYVEKFAAPVLDELTHVIASALSVRISIAGDRYTDISHIEFGEIIASRLEASGVTEFAWSAHRDENHQWLVAVSFERLGAAVKAVWSFDPKRLLLSPENELAITLSTQNSISDANFARLKPAPEPTKPASNLTESLADTQLVEPVIEIGRASDKLLSENATVASVIETQISESADLLDALKKKREERSARQAEAAEPITETQTIEIVAETLEPVAEYEIGEEPQISPEDIEPKPAPIRRNTRPSIPSFDEIVQGTKSEDD